MDTKFAGFKKIMVAYDGSKDAERAIEAASSLSEKYDAEVILIHCFTTPTIAYSAVGTVPIPNYHELESAAKDQAKEVLAKGLEVARTFGLKANGELIEASSILQGLVEFAANGKFDLLVSGTRGMTGFKRLVLGSVSSGLVGHAPCPVLVVR